MRPLGELRQDWLAEEKAGFLGWDFSHLDGRMCEEPLPWDYRQIVERHLRPEQRLLDMGTGGGEFLLSLEHPYSQSCVTEAYPPNAALCRERLVPLGITLREVSDYLIPYADAEFDIVLNRHSFFLASEVFRVLKPGGIFITQQVGSLNNRQLSQSLIPGFIPTYPDHNLGTVAAQLRDAGFTISDLAEAFPTARFGDVAAVVYFATIIQWEFPGFSVDRCFNTLLDLQQTLESQGFIPSIEHRFFLVSHKA